MRKILFFLCIVTACSFATQSDDHKIIILVSPPRSLSTAFLRMMEARGDFYIMHEPFIKPYWTNMSSSIFSKEQLFRPETLETVEKVKQAILEKSQCSNVFVKEMSFSIRDFLLDDIDLLKQKNVYFVFLLRNPHHVVISFYRKAKMKGEDLSDFIGWIDYKSVYELCNHVKKHGANVPILLRSEDLYINSEETIRQFCYAADIIFMPESLSWQDLGASFTGEHEWNDPKYQELVHYWHADAIHSTGFSVPSHYEIDDAGDPTFNEITDEKDRDICKKTYEENVIYYQKFFAKEFNDQS